MMAAQAGPAEPGEPTRPGVDLERLLELPPSLRYTVERRGGLTEGEWRDRFREVDAALAQERADLDDAQERLQEIAGETDAWKVAPALPGVQPSDEAPLDYGLRREIQRHRDEIERLERKRRDLEIEADLAGVPPAWRQASAPASGSGAVAAPDGEEAR